MSDRASDVAITPETKVSLTSGPTRLDLPERAVRRPATVRLEDGVTPPALSPDFHPRYAFRIGVAESGSPAPTPSSGSPLLFRFDRPGTATFSYAGMEDPNLPDTTLQVRLLAPRRNLWVEVPAVFDRQAKTVTVTVWHEGTYALIANAGLVPLQPVVATIGPNGGSITFNRLRVDFPAGAFIEDTQVTVGPPPPYLLAWQGGLPFPFSVVARRVRDGQEIHQLGAPVQFTADYDDSELGTMRRDTLGFRTLNATRQRWDDLPGAVDQQAHRIGGHSSHLSDFSVGGGDFDINQFDFGSNWLQVDEFRGNLTLAIPFELPPGPGGFAPKLMLTYNSQSSHLDQRTNQLDFTFNNGVGQQSASWVGEGFDLPIGYVQMMVDPINGANQYYSVSIFGQSFRLGKDGNGVWHTTDEQFWKIDQNGTDAATGVAYQWRVITPDGTKYYFGTDTINHTDLSYYYDFNANAQKVNRWLLSRAEDPHGNLILVSWGQLWKQVTSTSGNGMMTVAVYPTQISYGGSDAANLPYAIKFNRSGTAVSTLDPNNPQNGLDRGDVDWANWIQKTTSQLTFDIKYLDSLDVEVSSSVARHYQFTYANQANGYAGSNPLMLQSVAEWSDAQGTMQQPVVGSSYLAPIRITDYPTSGTPVEPEYGYRFLGTLTNAFGGTFTFAYTLEGTPVPPGSNITTYQDTQGPTPTKYYVPVLLVQSVTRDPGFGGTKITVNYPTYNGPLGNTNPSWPEFWGHGSVTKTDSSSTTVTTFLQNSGSVGLGRVTDVTVKDAALNLVRETQNTWTVDTPFSSSVWAHRDQMDVLAYDGGTTVLGHKQTTYQHNVGQQGTNPYDGVIQFGNLTDIREYDASPGTSGNWLRHTKRWFYPGLDADHYVVNKVAREDVYSYDGSTDGTMVRSTLHCYDGTTDYATAIGSGPNGWASTWGYGALTTLRRTADVPTNSSFFDTGYTYDQYGNLLTETRYNSYGTATALASTDGRATTYTYDSTYHAYKISVQNALLQTTSYTYDFIHNRLQSVTDPNTALTWHTYDDLGRRIATWLPGDSQTSPTPGPGNPGAASITYRYLLTGNLNNGALVSGSLPTRIQVGTRKDADGGTWGKRAYAWQFYDGLGRVIQTQIDFDRSSFLAHAQDVNEVGSGISADGGSTTFGGASAGTSLIKASDFTELQSGIQGLWSGGALGTLPDWSSNLTPGGPSLSTTATPIFGSDLVDLRTYLNYYEQGISPPKTLTAWTNNVATITVANRFYDNRGLLQAESVPHNLTLTVPGQFDSSDWNQSTNATTTSTYDALKRPLTRTQPDTVSTASWSYVGWSTTATDEDGHPTVSTKDVFGRLASVEEEPSASGYLNHNLTTYGYDVADELLSVVDASGQNTTTITYDSLGRKTAMSDPDLGGWSYLYPTTPNVNQPLWLVATQTDALGQTLTFQYDQLDRITSKTGTNLSMGYTYDSGSGTNLVGRRASMSDGAGSATYSYSPRGQLTSFTRVINGSTYLITTVYDEQDRVVSQTFPNGDVLTYTYGDHGKAVSLNLNGWYLVRGATYNALLKPTSYPLGNGLVTLDTYWGIDHKDTTYPYKSFGLPYELQTASFQQMTFGVIDPLGNPTSITYTDHTSESLSFTYNDLNQLTRMSGSVNGTESYAYLQGPTGSQYNLGNVASVTLGSLQAIYTYPTGAGALHPHTPTNISTTGNYTYDANGNRKTDPTYAYSYDVENHLVTLTYRGTTVLSNTYDGDGARIVRTQNNQTTHYVGGAYEYNVTTQTATTYCPFNGEPIACKQGNLVTYLHHDQVGSLVSATNTVGQEVFSARYWPFGQIRSSAGTPPIDRLFASQMQDLNDACLCRSTSVMDDRAPVCRPG